MSKEVQIVAWCDGDHEVDTLAVIEREVTLDRSKPVVLDLCEPCDKVMQDLQALMDRGVRVAAPPQPAKSVVCPECGKSVVSRDSLSKHLRKVHDTGLREYDATHPSDPEVRKTRAPRGEPHPDHACPEGGCDYLGSSRAALNQHVRAAHGKTFSDYPGFVKTTRS